MPVLGPLPLQCYWVIYFILIACWFYYMVLKPLPYLTLIAKPCMLLEKLPCTKSLNWMMSLICCTSNIVLVFCLYHMCSIYACFLFKQSTHIIFVHNIFYDVFGFYESNKLCSAYSVYRHSHDNFKACVWHAFYVYIT